MTIMRVSKSLLLLFSVLVATGSFSSAALATNDYKTGLATVVATTLPSGQQLYVVKTRSDSVTIDTWVNTGSVNENAENNGVSHFLEHLLFKGTPSQPVGAFERQIEAWGGQFNAATSDDFTHYHITVASAFLKPAMALHADMLLHATMPNSEIDRERLVVLEEMNRAADNPQHALIQTLNSKLFAGHPYALDTLGPRQNISNLSRGAILGYYQRWYQPANFKTVVVGNVTPSEVQTIVQQAFQPAKAVVTSLRPVTSKPLPAITPLRQPVVQIITDDALSQATLALGFIGPALSATDKIQRNQIMALDLATSLLGGSKGSRLVQNLQLKQHWVEGISAGNFTKKHAGLVYVTADLNPASISQAVGGILASVAQLAQTPPSVAEVQQQQRNAQRAFLFQQESTADTAENIGYNVTLGSLNDYTQYLEELSHVTPEAISQATAKFMQPSQAVLVVALPKSASAQIPELKQALLPLLQKTDIALDVPPLKPAINMATSGRAAVPHSFIHKVRLLENGPTLLLQPNPQAQTVALEIMMPGGQRSESQPGVSALTAALLTKATRYRGTENWAAWLDAHGITASASAEADYIRLSLQSLSSDLPSLLTALGELFKTPVTESPELPSLVALEKKTFEAALKASLESPSAVLFDQMASSLFGWHSYGHNTQTTLRFLPLITPWRVKQSWQQQLNRLPQWVISVSGNVGDAQEFQTALQSALPITNQHLKSTRILNRPASGLKTAKTQQIIRAQQTALWVAQGWQIPPVGHADYAAIKVLNAMLGQGMSSLLFQELREKQGLAYTVGSMSPCYKLNGQLVLYIGSDPKNRDALLPGFQKTLQQLAALLKTPEGEKAVAEGKTKLVGTFVMAHETQAQQAMYPAMYEVLGVGSDYDTTYPQLVERVTVQDVARVLEKYVLQAPSSTVVVGPAAPTAPKVLPSVNAQNQTIN